jgi:carboxypeptidase Taq
MEDKISELKRRLAEISHIDSAINLLGWDQQTYMPSGGAGARGDQIATLAQISQEKLVDPAMGQLLDDLRPYEERLSYDDDDAAMIRVGRRNYERSVKIPPALIGELANHQAQSFNAWVKARPANDFKAVIPFLEKTLDLSRQIANCFPGYESIADPLIDFSDFGMTARSVQKIFGDLRRELVPLVHAILSRPIADDSCLHGSFPEDQQLAFGSEVIKRFGFDLNHGRQDKAPHPFTTRFSIGDVRITTRIKINNLGEALFSSTHEAGHGMYEQGINQAYEATPLANGTSSGVHESQSRLWENLVGRSYPFWTYFYPRLQDIFPDQLCSVPLDIFYRAINKVDRSLIRTDADEVTYNLHVMLRFDFELALLEGKLAVRDLPEAWNARFKEDLGITPPQDREGVLQDIHWFGGIIGGAFQGYTLGNIMSAQFYAAALQAHPEIPTQIAQGNFEPLHQWLVDNIYQYGSKYTASDLLNRVTGKSIMIEPYINYLKQKYGPIYSLQG